MDPAVVSATIKSSSVVSLAILSTIYFVENYGRSLISVSPIPYIDYNSYQYSLLSGTLFAIVYTLGGLFFSVTNSLNQYRVYAITVACLVFSVAIFIVPFAETFWQQALIRIVMGLAQSVVTPFSSGIISSHFPERYRGIAFSIFNFGAYLSFSLSLSLGTFIYDLYGWKAGYYLFGLFGVALSILTPFLVQEDPSLDHDPLRLSVSSGDPTDQARETKGSLNDHLPLLEVSSYCSSSVLSMMDLFGRVLSVWRRNPSLYLLCLATGVRLGAGYVWTSYTSVYYSELYVSSTDESGDNGSNDDKCLFSYNRTFVSPSLTGDSSAPSPWAHEWPSSSVVCESDYPYCFTSSGSWHPLC
jgi:MFS family permease